MQDKKKMFSLAAIAAAAEAVLGHSLNLASEEAVQEQPKKPGVAQNSGMQLPIPCTAAGLFSGASFK